MLNTLSSTSTFGEEKKLKKKLQENFSNYIDKEMFISKYICKFRACAYSGT